jgi:hypothetical protein
LFFQRQSQWRHAFFGKDNNTFKNDYLMLRPNFSTAIHNLID